MKRSIFFLLLTCFVGCGETQNSASYLHENTLINGSKNYKLILLKNTRSQTGTATLNLVCDNVFNSGANADWSMQNVMATSSVMLIENKVCRITLVNFSDGINTYQPVSSSLVINIGSSGVVSSSSAVQYTNGSPSSPVLQWFAAGSGGPTYSVIINYAADAITATTINTTTNYSSLTFNVSDAAVVAPTVSNITLTRTQVLLVDVYTLTAVVSGSTGCKYITNAGTPPTYTASSWTSVNTAYNNSGATTCPVLTVGSINLAVGNWTSVWTSGANTLMMWANSVNGVNAYTTANIGP